MNPRSFEIQFNYGTIALAVGAYSEALNAFQQANQIQPNNVSVITGQGTALFRLGKKQAAIATLKAALALNPSYEPARTTLGDLIKQTNQLNNNSREKGK